MNVKLLMVVAMYVGCDQLWNFQMQLQFVSAIETSFVRYYYYNMLATIPTLFETCTCTDGIKSLVS